MRTRALGLALLFTIASCATTRARTEVVVRIEAEPGVIAEATRVHVVVRAGPNRTEDSLATRSDRTFPETGTTVFPLELALVPADGDASRVFEVTATAQRGSAHTDFAMARVISGYVEGQTLAVTLRLEDACRDLPACDPGNTCHQAMCVDAYVAPTTLAPFVQDASALPGMDADIDAAVLPGTDANIDAWIDPTIDAARDTGPGVDGGSGGTRPRPVWPPNGAYTSRADPLLRWELASGADGVRVEVCSERACTNVLTTLDSTDASGRVAMTLSRRTIFWRMFSTHGGSVETTPGPTWLLHTGIATSGPDGVWGNTIDGDGDGFEEVAIGWSKGSSGGFDEGYRGSSGGLMTMSSFGQIVTSGHSYYGSSIASAGDVDGNGFPDLLVGVPRSGTWGEVGLFLGTTNCYAMMIPTYISSTGTDNRFGAAVAGIGDINGDGYADVALGAPSGMTSGYFTLYTGQGGSGSLSPGGDVVAPATGVPMADFGVSIAGAGDLDADGLSDFIVGADYAGRAYVYPGSTTGGSAMTLMEGATIERFGAAVAGIGDVNGDGYPDVAVGAPFGGGGQGTVYVYYGDPGLIVSTAASSIPGPDGSGCNFGWSVGGGDVTGDGYSDLVVGAPGYTINQGRIYVYAGSPSGLGGSPITMITGAANESLGRVVRFVGDVSGDGIGDVAAGGQVVHVYSGSGAGLVATPILTSAPPGVSYAAIGGQ